MAKVVPSSGSVKVILQLYFLLLMLVEWGLGKSKLNLTSAKVECEVMAELGQLDAVNA